MFAHKRLLGCFDTAMKNNDVIEVTEDTKIIFFSDVHRGDNSLTDEFARNQNIYFYALSEYFDKGYTYIEVGDGDELWEYGKFEHIRSAHSDVFCLLRDFYKEGRFEYMFGNHNMSFRNPIVSKYYLTHFFDEYFDIDTPLFPGIRTKESMILKDMESDKEILVVHGHQGDFINDQGWIISKLLMKFFWRFMHMIGFQNPASPAKSRIKRHRIEKNFTKWIKRHQMGILCGHTHRPKLPDLGDPAYMNTGCCVHPRGITGIELNGRSFSLVYWTIKPNKEGTLFIMKKVIKGPMSFDELNI